MIENNEDIRGVADCGILLIPSALDLESGHLAYSILRKGLESPPCKQEGTDNLHSVMAKQEPQRQQASLSSNPGITTC